MDFTGGATNLNCQQGLPRLARDICDVTSVHDVTVILLFFVCFECLLWGSEMHNLTVNYLSGLQQ